MSADPGAVRALTDLLEARTGQQLAPNRSWRIDVALKPLLRSRGLQTPAELASLASRVSEERLKNQIVEALLNNETYFFRDLSVFSLLRGDALDALHRARAERRQLRIWCAGCSTGQEAYSIAMMIGEEPARWQDWSIEILGTDISASAIEQAASGRYSQFEIQRGLPVGAMMRWFDQQDEYWRALPELRAKLRFRSHSLLDAPPPGRFDLILCRNVLMYFSPEVRRGVFDRLASSIAPDGLLALGASETVLGQTECFTPDRVLRGLYRPLLGVSH